MQPAIKALFALTLALIALPLFAATSHNNPTDWHYPAIRHAGGVVELPNADLHPDPLDQYKVVFNLTKNADTSKINGGLKHVARTVNLFALSNVEPGHRHLDVVIHGPATVIVLDNKGYKQRYGRKNPNLELIHALKKAGVEFYVCGQALAEAHIPHNRVAKPIDLSLSALTDLIILQQKGYVLLPL
jgi:intracellular sulfur oxidation DsrE/DsrF family protein